MEPTIYATDYDGMFIPPVDPRHHPQLPVAATSQQKMGPWHDTNVTCWNIRSMEPSKHDAVTNSKRSFMRTTWPSWKMLIWALPKKNPKEIFDHDIAQYAKTTILMQNEKQWEFKQPMDPNKLFVVYTKLKEKCQRFTANAKEAITEANMINTGLMHVIATSLITTKYCEWKRFKDMERTWSKIKEHFNEAFNKLQELIEITTRGTSFGANVMEFTSPTAIDKISGALNNLANATLQKMKTWTNWQQCSAWQQMKLRDLTK